MKNSINIFKFRWWVRIYVGGRGVDIVPSWHITFISSKSQWQAHNTRVGKITKKKTIQIHELKNIINCKIKLEWRVTCSFIYLILDCCCCCWQLEFWMWNCAIHGKNKTWEVKLWKSMKITHQHPSRSRLVFEMRCYTENGRTFLAIQC